jgi:carboxyl-terminal processing protease
VNLRDFFVYASPLILLAGAMGFMVGDARARPQDPSIYWSDSIVGEMRSLVEETYVDEVGPEQARALFYAACKAYVSALDPYCEFYTPEELKSFEQETQGEFGGVGILGVQTTDGILVRGARIGDPAWTVGIRAGDRIVAVDGVATSSDPAESLLPRLRGDPGSDVTVRWIPREGGAPREAAVRRSEIKIDSVLGVELLDNGAGIGYLRIARFQENTAADVRTALGGLRAAGARSFIIDLRGDLGGVLNGAVSVADLFLPVEGGGPRADTVVTTRGRSGVGVPLHRSRKDPDDDTTSPLVLLVDGATASAAEILAGALQDQGRAVLIGERTYGKFLVQRIVPLEKEGVAVRLTTARYYTPHERNLQRDDSRGVRGGLVPDVPLKPEDEQRDAISRRLNDQVGLDWDLMPGEGQGVPVEDPALDRALMLMRDLHAAGQAGK